MAISCSLEITRKKENSRGVKVRLEGVTKESSPVAAAEGLGCEGGEVGGGNSETGFSAM